ncbi:MAG: PilZ domain-containing protein [Thermodesulfobacteriota bacterium]
MTVRARNRLLPATAGILLALAMSPQAAVLLRHAGQRWLHILMISLLAAALFTPLVRSLAFRIGALDQPDHRKRHKAPTALLGGLAVYGGFMAALVANAIFDRATVVTLTAGSVIMAVSLIDDVRHLPATFKLAVQLCATATVVAAGVRIELLPTGDAGETARLLAGTGNTLLSFLWIVGITNAMNFLDGMDGLAAGLTAVISLFLGIVAFQTGQPQLGWTAMAMLGASLGFLPFNFRRDRPALIFLGDAGSTFMGFTLACLAIRGDWSSSSPLVSLFTPILLFGVLIFDMIHTTVARIWTGRVKSFRDWVAYVGRDHIHHRLQRLFLSDKKAVLFILAIGGCLGISAVVMREAGIFHASLLVLQGCLGFLMFSITNFYQERTFVRLRNDRSAFRLQEHLDVEVRPAEGTGQQALLLDISATGARIMYHAGVSLEPGMLVSLGDHELLHEEPRGRVVWSNRVLLDELPGHYSSEFAECGISFIDFSPEQFQRFVCNLYQKQISDRRSRFLDPGRLPLPATRLPESVPCTANTGI